MEFTPVSSIGRGRGLRYADVPDRERVGQPSFGSYLGMDEATSVEKPELPMPIVKPKSSLSMDSVTPVVKPQSSLGIDNVTPAARPMSSTPITTDSDTLGQIRDLLGELGTQIGDSVVNRLLANQMTAPIRGPPPPSSLPLLDPSPFTPDMSRLSVVVKTDAKEPAAYRGDGTDKYTVQEWIGVMDTYLHKRGCSAGEQVDEILSHLLGRAKNIVKVGLKSNSDKAAHPEVIYDILRRYFSDCPMSSLPLADFYATHPDVNESPVDYWVRLNTAAEHADRHLRNSGGKMENMSVEVAMMFIRNCPNSDLSSVFRCKPISKWSAMEVQEAIDEHQREHQTRKGPSRAERLVVATATATSSPVAEELTAMRASVQEPTAQAKKSAATTPEAGALERVLSMLESLLARTASPIQQPTQWSRPSPCRVCGEKTHVTREHCMKEKRCFGCLELGHQKRDCTRATPHQTQPESRTPNQGN